MLKLKKQKIKEETRKKKTDRYENR